MNDNRLTGEDVLNWFGEDEKKEIAEYIASILCNIERGFVNVSELIDEIKEYDKGDL